MEEASPPKTLSEVEDLVQTSRVLVPELEETNRLQPKGLGAITTQRTELQHGFSDRVRT